MWGSCVRLELAMGMSGGRDGCCVAMVVLAAVAFMAVASSPSSAAAAAATAPVDPSDAILITVDQSGKGDLERIQDAIDAVPSNNTDLIFILIKPGIYREKIVIPADKPFITLSGTNQTSTIITWSDGVDTFQSATVTILASDFVGRYLTIQNTFGSGAQAVALRVSGDRAAFYGCRIRSYQDTLLDDTGKHYYSNCYIEGATDFICGNALSLFEKCHLHSTSRNGGAITAQHRSSEEENTGYSFFQCKITGRGHALLGRPWGPFSRVVFAFTYMSRAIAPRGWDDWDKPSTHSTVFYGEYKCFGPGAKRSGRVSWSRALSSEEAAPFMDRSMIDGDDWLRPPPTRFRRASTIVADHKVATR